jgi:hypothetical protein
MVALLVASYILAGGFSLASAITSQMQSEDSESDSENEIGQTLKEYGQLVTAAIVAAIYSIMYGVILVMLRQLGLSWLSKLGRMKKVVEAGEEITVATSVSHVFNEIIEYSHRFKLPEVVNFKKSIMQGLVDVATYSVIPAGVACVLICWYMFLFKTKPDPDINNDVQKVHIDHYIEGMKTLAIIICAALMIWAVVKQVCAQQTAK